MKCHYKGDVPEVFPVGEPHFSSSYFGNNFEDIYGQAYLLILQLYWRPPQEMQETIVDFQK